MYLRKLSLNNFQKHSSLELNFQSGVNIIYGASDAGKSCIRRAIGFLFFGDPRTDVIRKEGTKQTSVLGVLDNGIEVERIKSATVNRYVIRREGKELIYDSVGASIPEEVQKILQVSTINVDDKEKPLNLNVAEQISLPFLLDKSGSFRLKLFNKLTGNDLVDKVMQNLNKEILSIGKDIKSEQEFIFINEPKFQEVTQQVTEKSKLLGNFKEKHEIIKTQNLTLQSLKILQSSVNENNESLDIVQTSLGEIKIVPQEKIEVIKTKTEKLKNLKSLGINLAEFNVDLQFTTKKLNDIKIVAQDVFDGLKSSINQYIGLSDIKEGIEANKRAVIEAETALKAIKSIKVDTEALKVKISTLEALNRVKKALSNGFDQSQKAILEIDDTSGNIKILDKQYQDLLKEAQFCPVCKRSTCEEHI